MAENPFGGPWTEEKLGRLKKYLPAYMKIFKSNEKARFIQTVYVDAFAGTGLRRNRELGPESSTFDLFGEDRDADSFMKGSAYEALEVTPPFDRYLFIEKDPEFASELGNLKKKFPRLASRIEILTGDANEKLKNWALKSDWKKQRAVVFLDPYGMQVDWKTVELLAKTQGVDLWYLFPLGAGVNRLLVKKQVPTGAWADRLTRVFGTSSWIERFYKKETRRDLFGEIDHVYKDADFQSISEYVVERLSTVFSRVANNPLLLRNSRGNPIFLLCFAASNPRGAPTAVKIAQYVLRG